MLKVDSDRLLLDEKLCQAVSDNDLKKIKDLLRKGANAKCNDNDPLRIACFTFNTEAADILIKAGANTRDRRCLDFIMKHNNLDLFLLLTKRF